MKKSGKELGSERALTIDGDTTNTVAEMVKASLLVLGRPDVSAEWLDMLGLTDFLRERMGQEVGHEPCPKCGTPQTPENTGHHGDGRPFCRECRNIYRRGLRARQRALRAENGAAA